MLPTVAVSGIAQGLLPPREAVLPDERLHDLEGRVDQGLPVVGVVVACRGVGVADQQWCDALAGETGRQGLEIGPLFAIVGELAVGRGEGAGVQ